MLDHVFTDAIGALRDAFENALLERQAFEERFQADVLLGDLTWETSYGLPGEGSRRRGCEPTSRSTGRPGRRPRTAPGTSASRFDEGPRIEIEIVLRIQRLAQPPDRVGGPRRAARAEPADRRRAARALRPDGRERSTATTSPRRSTPSRCQLRGQLRARRGHAEGRLDARRPLRRDGRLDRVDARAAGRPEVRVPAPRPGEDSDASRRAAGNGSSRCSPAGYQLVEAPRGRRRGRRVLHRRARRRRVPVERRTRSRRSSPKRRGVGGLALHADGGVVVSGPRRHARRARRHEPAAVRAARRRDRLQRHLRTRRRHRSLAGGLRFLPFAGEDPVPGAFWHVTAPDDAERRARRTSMWPNGVGDAGDGTWLLLRLQPRHVSPIVGRR